MSTEDLGKLILLIAGLLALLASSLIHSGDTTQATLEWVRGHDTQAYIATLIGLAAVPFYLGGVVADWLSMREVDARLALLAAVSFTVGYVGLAAIGGSQGFAYALAADETVDLKNLAATMERSGLEAGQSKSDGSTLTPTRKKRQSTRLPSKARWRLCVKSHVRVRMPSWTSLSSVGCTARPLRPFT